MLKRTYGHALVLPSRRLVCTAAEDDFVKPNGANTFLANGIAAFINGPASLLNNLPKNPPDCINFFICALLNFILVAKLLLIALRNLVFCLVVNNNPCGSSSLLEFLIPNLNDAPSLDLTAFFNLFICTFVNLQFILVYILFLFNIL